jgi:hypothetical protein
MNFQKAKSSLTLSFNSARFDDLIR